MVATSYALRVLVDLLRCTLAPTGRRGMLPWQTRPGDMSLGPVTVPEQGPRCKKPPILFHERFNLSYALDPGRSDPVLSASTEVPPGLTANGEEDAMRRYIALLSFTDQGIRNVKQSLKRAEWVKKIAAKRS